jgi:hypothetical protein
MNEMTPAKRPRRGLEDMPEWMHSLKGFDKLTLKRFESADKTAEHEGLLRRNPPDKPAYTSGTWRMAIAMPRDIAESAEQVDPILFLPSLAQAIGELDARITEIVRYCRATGRTWTQIGEALSISKQAAWQRFSGED